MVLNRPHESLAARDAGGDGYSRDVRHCHWQGLKQLSSQSCRSGLLGRMHRSLSEFLKDDLVSTPFLFENKHVSTSYRCESLPHGDLGHHKKNQRRRVIGWLSQLLHADER